MALLLFDWDTDLTDFSLVIHPTRRTSKPRVVARQKAITGMACRVAWRGLSCSLAMRRVISPDQKHPPRITNVCKAGTAWGREGGQPAPVVPNKFHPQPSGSESAGHR